MEGTRVLYLEKNLNSSPWLTRVHRAAWSPDQRLWPPLTQPGVPSHHLWLSPGPSFRSSKVLGILRSPPPLKFCTAGSSQLFSPLSASPPQKLTPSTVFPREPFPLSKSGGSQEFELGKGLLTITAKKAQGTPTSSYQNLRPRGSGSGGGRGEEFFLLSALCLQ